MCGNSDLDPGEIECGCAQQARRMDAEPIKFVLLRYCMYCRSRRMSGCEWWRRLTASCRHHPSPTCPPSTGWLQPLRLSDFAPHPPPFQRYDPTRCNFSHLEPCPILDVQLMDRPRLALRVLAHIAGSNRLTYGLMCTLLQTSG